MIEELTVKPFQVILNIETQSAITLIKTDIVNKPSKHIDVRLFFYKKSDVRQNLCKTLSNKQTNCWLLDENSWKSWIWSSENISKFNPNLSN